MYSVVNLYKRSYDAFVLPPLCPSLGTFGMHASFIGARSLHFMPGARSLHLVLALALFPMYLALDRYTMYLALVRYSVFLYQRLFATPCIWR